MTRVKRQRLVSTTIVLTVLLTISIKKVNSKPGCDLESIFQTPQNRNYDHLEILERSNFENDEKNEQTIQPITHHPKSYANAQVLLRFNGENLRKPPSEYLPPHPCPYCRKDYHPASCACGRHCRCHHNLPFMYPMPVAIPVCFYYNHNPLKLYNFSPITTPSSGNGLKYFCQLTTPPSEPEPEEPIGPIIPPISNNHPEILHPIQLTTTETMETTPLSTTTSEELLLEEEEETDEPTTTTNSCSEDQTTEPVTNPSKDEDEQCPEDSTTPQIDPKPPTKNTSEIVVNKIESSSYDPIASKEESNIKYVNIDVEEQSSEDLRQDLEEESDGGRDEVIIPVMPNCNNHHKKKKANFELPKVKNSLLDLLVPRIVEELLSRKLDHLIDEPKYHYSGYKMSAGSGYYSDPTKTVLYRQPTVIKVVKSQQPTVVSSQQEPSQVLIDPGYYPNHGKSCRCRLCNNYVRELNE